MTKPVKPADLMIGRAYSVLEVKKITDEQRVIEGVATTPTTDRMGDVIEPLGVEFKNPLPLLWHHNSAAPVGHATFAKATKDGIRFRAKIAQTDEPGALKDRLDEAWQSVKLGLVRGVSIGFKALEFEFMDDGKGIHFSKTSVLELSLVTIPANSEANIQAIRSVDAASRADGGLDIDELRKQYDARLAASGAKPSIATPAGVTAVKQPTVVKAKAMKQTIAEQILAYEATRAAKSERMAELMNKAADEQVTLDEAQSEEYDTLEADVKKVDEHLVRLRRQEEYNKQNAIAVTRVDDAQKASEVRAGKPFYGDNRVISVRQPMEKGLGSFRVALARFGARNEGVHPAEYARQLYPQYPDIELAVRAAIAPGTTTDSTWAGPLVVYQNMNNELIELLYAASIIGRINGLRRVPFKIKLPRQTGAATVNWVGETKVKPVGQLAFDSITMDHHKIAGIVPLSEELWRLSNPSAEALVRDSLINEIVEKMDRDFVDPTKAEESGVSPASITNGVSATTATGTTAAALRADVKTLFSTMASNNLSTASGHWIMTQQQAIAISMMVTSLSQPEFPGITPTGGTFYGFPVVASENIPATGGSPTDGYPLIFALANQILLADDGIVSIDVSREASLQMDSAPDSPPTASTTLVSLWQHNLVAVKGERWVTWKKARDTAVAYIQNAKYAE